MPHEPCDTVASTSRHRRVSSATSAAPLQATREMYYYADGNPRLRWQPIHLVTG